MQFELMVERDANKDGKYKGPKTIGSQCDDQNHQRGEQDKKADRSDYLDMEKTSVPVCDKIDEPRREHEEDGQQIPSRCAPSRREFACLPDSGFSADDDLLVKIPLVKSSFR